MNMFISIFFKKNNSIFFLSFVVFLFTIEYNCVELGKDRNYINVTFIDFAL